MKIATILNVHGNVETTKDTIESIQKWMTNDIMVVVDGAAWNEVSSEITDDVEKLEGFYHNHPKSPYRNILFGLMNGINKWPDADWYCYMEYDCLVANDEFKSNLIQAAANEYWCLGADYRKQDIKLPLLEKMLRTKFESAYYLLGCCVFHKGEFLRGLHKANFFERLLYYTNDFTKGYFPEYEEQGGYDFSEHLFPTLAIHYGGRVGGLSRWDQRHERWTAGDHKKFPIRWKPDLSESDVTSQASILHPIKENDHPLRIKYRKQRNG